MGDVHVYVPHMSHYHELCDQKNCTKYILFYKYLSVNKYGFQIANISHTALILYYALHLTLVHICAKGKQLHHVFISYCQICH